MSALKFGPALRATILILANAALLTMLSRQWNDWNESRAAEGQHSAIAAGKVAEEKRLAKLVCEERAKLHAAKQRLPYGDGYIWTTKLLTSRHPRMQLWVAPSERPLRQVLNHPDYTTSVFRVRGTGTVSELTSLLFTVETEVPYAHVQDLVVQILPAANDRVEFCFSVLAVLRPEKEEPAL